MAYGMEQLRKAGRALRDFDRNYSDKVMDMYVDMNEENPNQLKAMIGLFAGGTPINMPYEPSPNNKPLMDKARITSTVAKYGMPTVGVTLAGKGIIDLTAAFGTAADQPEPNTLGM